MEKQVEEETAGPAAVDLRRGPWTADEDMLLVNYISLHGDGRWNSLARRAGLRRTGKSCRLRWLNYLRPDLRRGDITPEEQLLILDLHSRWGNRWSKIAQFLPGRTDNEIKNYWRTRVQKHAKQLRCSANSAAFNTVVRNLWMPRMAERINAAPSEACGGGRSGYENMSPTSTSDYTSSSMVSLGRFGSNDGVEADWSGADMAGMIWPESMTVFGECAGEGSPELFDDLEGLGLDEIWPTQGF